MSIQQPQYPVNYAKAARRHLKDARILKNVQQQANAGQLLGICVECGIKCLLLVCGVARDPVDGGIAAKHKLRTHFPFLSDRLLQHGHLVPNTNLMQSYLVDLHHLNDLADWTIDHRYMDETHLPLASLAKWECAAQEVSEMLDKLESAGHI
jgi:hypothetical protein